MITDRVTGLNWQGCAAGLTGNVCNQGTAGEYVWEEALDYCETLEWAGFTDWRLPTKYELDLMYAKRNKIGGFINDIYWSSTESGSNSAWNQNFSNGNQGESFKYNTYSIRAVRDF